jgi:acetate kinase
MGRVVDILVINCGSSSIKYRLFDMRTETELASGLIERIGEKLSDISFQSNGSKGKLNEHISDPEAGVRVVLRLLTEAGDKPPLKSIDEIDGVGHRVVHGGDRFYDSVTIDPQVVDAIFGFCELAPLHNPANLAGIEAAMHVLPGKPQVAVFDTAFFQTMPPPAYVYAVPYEWYKEKRIRRYGFHGTSHKYVSLLAAELLKKPAPNLVTLHLGNGCSASCIRGGKAIDQTMGLTPLEGLMMGTRSGDIDPAIIFHMTRQGLSMEQIHKALEKSGGLQGVSGVSRDLRDVKAAADEGNERAALAIDVFAHRVRKYVGAFMFELGHCDAVVFTGGIGENAAFMRAKILEGAAPLGLELDAERNAERSHGPMRISKEGSRVQAWVIPTNEELMIARDTSRLIGAH